MPDKILKEIGEILKCSNDTAAGLISKLTDEFRSGRDASVLESCDQFRRCTSCTGYELC